MKTCNLTVWMIRPRTAHIHLFSSLLTLWISELITNTDNQSARLAFGKRSSLPLSQPSGGDADCSEPKTISRKECFLCISPLRPPSSPLRASRVPLQSESHIHIITPPSHIPESLAPHHTLILFGFLLLSPPSSPRTDLNLVPLQLFYGTAVFSAAAAPPPVHDWRSTSVQCWLVSISCVRCHCCPSSVFWRCEFALTCLLSSLTYCCQLLCCHSVVSVVSFCSSLSDCCLCSNWWTVGPSLSAPLVTPCPRRLNLLEARCAFPMQQRQKNKRR